MSFTRRRSEPILRAADEHSTAAASPTAPRTIGEPAPPADPQPSRKLGNAKHTVAVRFPVDELDTGLQGVGVLTRDPQPISQDNLDKVKAAADSAGVALDITGEN